jgi:hypothetical protein
MGDVPLVRRANGARYVQAILVMMRKKLAKVTMVWELYKD